MCGDLCGGLCGLLSFGSLELGLSQMTTAGMQMGCRLAKGRRSESVQVCCTGPLSRVKVSCSLATLRVRPASGRRLWIVVRQTQFRYRLQVTRWGPLLLGGFLRMVGVSDPPVPSEHTLDGLDIRAQGDQRSKGAKRQNGRFRIIMELGMVGAGRREGEP